MYRYRLRPRCLPTGDFTALRDALLASPLVGRSTLAGPFQASRGFAVIFTAAGVARLSERFPALGPYLAQVLGAPAVRALTPFWRRRLPRIPNAWYLNVLLVAQGGSVGRHVDATLRTPAGVPDAVPEVVSVLYLQVPAAAGGALTLHAPGWPVAVVRPRENALLHFRGDLAHAVLPFDGAPGQLRASLVIEQYHLPDDALARLPECQVESRAGFAAFLDAHAQRGVAG